MDPAAEGERPVSASSKKNRDRRESDRKAVRYLYCLVFPGDDQKVDARARGGARSRKEFRETVIDELVEAGLFVEQFYSIQGDEVYVKVGATDHRLLLEADHVEYNLKLDPSAMRKVAEAGDDNRAPIYLCPPFSRQERFQKLVGGDRWVDMAPAELEADMRGETKIPAFEHMYARYNDAWEIYHKKRHGVQVYKVHGDGSLLRTMDRVKLIVSCMERSQVPDPDTGAKGASLHLHKMVYRKQLIAQYALHTDSKIASMSSDQTVDELHSRWSSWRHWPWNQPIKEIRNYFGESIAFYFAFLGHYTLWLLLCALIGLVVFGHQIYNVYYSGPDAPKSFFSPEILIYNSSGLPTGETKVFTEVPEAGFFAFFMGLWATFMLEFWKRKQARLAMEWGTSEYEKAESIRPEFAPSFFLPSPVTGKSEPYYSETRSQLKHAGSSVVILTCIVVVIAAVAGTFVLKVFVTTAESSFFSESNSTLLALFVNALTIQILSAVYKKIAHTLNEWENHRTDTSYEDSLITKTFMFTFVNSYATLFYMAFVKINVPILNVKQYCIVAAKNVPNASDQCFGALGYSLMIIFGTQLITNNLMEIALPALTNFIVKKSNLRVAKKKGAKTEDSQLLKVKSPCEDQFFLNSYEGTFADYLEVAIQFGYVTLFVSAFPFAPVLAMINNQLEIRVDSYKLCKLSRRPPARGAQDIGSWYPIFYYLAQFAIATNAGIICFTSQILPIPAWVREPQPGGINISVDAFRLFMFCVFIFVSYICKRVVDFMLMDVPQDVTIQLERQEFIVRKCLERQPDDEPLGGEENNTKAPHKECKIHTMDPEIHALLRKAGAVFMQGAGQTLAKLEELFRQYDTNGNGQISISNFETIVKKCGASQALSSTDIKVMSKALDKNDNGYVTFGEFLKFIAKYESQLSAPDLSAL